MPNEKDTSAHDARKPNDADRFVGRKLRQGRRELGLTQDGLATLLGVTFQQIQKYEAGHSRMSAGRLREVAIALKKPIHFFFEPFDVGGGASSDAVRHLKVKDLRRDAKKLVDALHDEANLRAVVTMLAAMEQTDA